MAKKPVVYEYRVAYNDCHQIEIRHVSGGSASLHASFADWTPYAWYEDVEQVKHFMAFVAKKEESPPAP